MTDPSKFLQATDVQKESPPVYKFLYSYNYPFLTVAQGFLHKFTYEPRSQLTTVAGVEQLDDDRFVFYRRSESVYSPKICWEKVIVDRRDGGKITSDLVEPLSNQVGKVFERGTL